MTTSTPNTTSARQRRLPLSILVTIALWALGTLAIFLLSQGRLPFQLPIYQAKGAGNSFPKRRKRESTMGNVPMFWGS